MLYDMAKEDWIRIRAIINRTGIQWRLGSTAKTVAVRQFRNKAQH